MYLLCWIDLKNIKQSLNIMHSITIIIMELFKSDYYNKYTKYKL